MKYLIVGLGSIGRRHAKLLKQVDSDAEIIAFRSQKSEDPFAKEHNITNFYDYEEALAQQPDAVLICNPTSMHAEYAIKAAESGCHIFIEKPLSHNMNTINDLRGVIEQNNLICLVAYCLRYHKAISGMKQWLDEGQIGAITKVDIKVGAYLPDWRGDKDITKFYSSIKELGGGVLLDLSHEIDYCLWYLEGEVFKEVIATKNKESQLGIEVEEVVDIEATTNSDIDVQLHLDYITKPPTRSCKIDGEDGTISWDLQSGIVRLERKDGVVKKGTNMDFSDLDQMYIDQLKDFIDCIKLNKQPKVTFEDGVKVLEFIDQVRAAWD